MTEIAPPGRLDVSWPVYATIVQHPDGKYQMYMGSVGVMDMAFEGTGLSYGDLSSEAAKAFDKQEKGTPWGDFIDSLRTDYDSNRSFSFHPGYTFHWRCVNHTF